MGRILVGILFGLILFPAMLLLYLQYGNPPTAVGDRPLFHEEDLTQAPLKYRVPRVAPQSPPFSVNEENLVAGARVYRENCVSCHGLHGKEAPIGTRMYPMAPALWERSATDDNVGVSGSPAGETYWKVANGLRLSGMPAYQGILTDTQIWQVSLLLANANKPLPPAALSFLRDQAAQPAPQTPAKAGRAPKGDEKIVE
jgi:mono/diheme cytochrome c family protein